ncbi:MAG: TonB-dependent receptor [Bacteroidota bacterium]
MRGILSILLFLILVPASAAQSLSGRVTDADGTAVPGVNVTVPALERGAATDADGRYTLGNLPSGALTVVFSAVGYERAERTVTVRGAVTLDVTLAESVEALEAITVREDRVQEALARAPQSIAVLDAEDLDAVRGQTLGQTLERLPGVTTLSTGPSIQKPVIRGLHSDRVIVINKGVPQEGQQWGAEHAPEIDPFSGARIEVVRGAAGVEYGAGAIGGVVRIEDEPLPRTPGWSGQFSTNAFSNSSQAAGSLELEGSPVAVPGLGVRARGSFRRAGDARTPDYVLGNTAFSERSAEVALGYALGALDLEARASHFGTDLGVYRGSHFNSFDALDAVFEAGRPPVDYAFEYEVGAPKQDITHNILALRGRYDFGAGAQAEVQYGVQRNRRQEFDASRIGSRDPLERPAFDLVLITQTLDAKLQARPARLLGGDVLSSVGLHGMTQGNRSEIGYLIPNFRFYDGGAWARATWARGPVTVETGARLDGRWLRAFPRSSGDRGDFVETVRTWAGASGALGAIWQFAESWSASANASAAWRPPSVNELYSFGIHHGTAQFEVGDAALETERSLGLDATLRHESRRVSLEVSTYATRIADYLYLAPVRDLVVTIRGIFPEFRHQQTDARLVGFDGALDVNVGRGFGLGLTAAAVRGTDTERDEPLLAMPADRLGLSASYTLPSSGALRTPEVGLGATFVREQDRFPVRLDADGDPIALDYAPPPGGYALLGAELSGELRFGGTPVRLSLEVENILNTRYRDYLSRYRYFAHDPGRNVILRLQVPLGSP